MMARHVHTHAVWPALFCKQHTQRAGMGVALGKWGDVLNLGCMGYWGPVGSCHDSAARAVGMTVLLVICSR